MSLKRNSGVVIFLSGGGHIDTVGDGFDVKGMEEYIKKQGISKSQMKLFQFAAS